MNYKLKSINEDFQVAEVSLMPHLEAKEPYQFTYVLLQKSGFTTFEALGQIKNFFKLEFNDLNSQGLKDEDAITEQLISVKKVLNDKDIVSFNKKHKLKTNFLTLSILLATAKNRLWKECFMATLLGLLQEI